MVEHQKLGTIIMNIIAHEDAISQELANILEKWRVAK
jgi:hypothetical protein